MERLQKIIANKGYCSRRKAEELITAGRVKVNNKVIRELGFKAEESDTIKIDDIFLENEEKIYFLLNKPRGVISTTVDDKNRKTVIDLIDTNLRIYPVGRLDYDTTGLIILTNDGDFANYLMHPKNEIEKVYIAKINNYFEPRHFKLIKDGLIIDGKKTSKAKIKLKKYDKKTNTSIIELCIYEGRNHQVKKMFEALGYEVLKLKRERIAFLTLDGLKSKEYRRLNPKEIKQLYSLSNK